MRLIDEIVIHCSFTRPDQYIGFKEIDEWHKARGWSGCGYHEIINRHGRLELGRPPQKKGAHVSGHNDTTYAICVIGGMDETGRAQFNYTFDQLAELRYRIQYNVQRFGTIKRVSGHNEHSNKECPIFSIPDFFNLEEFLKQ